MSTRRVPDTPPPGDSTPAGGGDQAAAVRALAREVAQLAAGVQQLTAKAGRAEDTATAAANAVTTLSKAVQDLYDRGGHDDGDQGDGSGAGPTPPWWHVDNPEQARAILADLTDWIADVYGRHHDAGALPGCWPLHPDVVTELVALHDGWQAAYYGKFASPAAVLDWLDRWRPNTVKRVNAVLGKCRMEKHEGGGEWVKPTRSGGELVDDVATWWAASQGRTEPPSPSPDAVAAEKGRRSQRDRW